jgi:hypothetical protein
LSYGGGNFVWITVAIVLQFFFLILLIRKKSIVTLERKSHDKTRKPPNKKRKKETLGLDGIWFLFAAPVLIQSPSVQSPLFPAAQPFLFDCGDETRKVNSK